MNIQLGFRRIEHDFSDLNDLLNSLNSCKPESVHFVTCPKQGREMEAVVLHRVGFLAYPFPKQGQDFKPSAAPLYPNMGQVPPHPPQNALQSLQKSSRNFSPSITFRSGKIKDNKCNSTTGFGDTSFVNEQRESASFPFFI